MSIDTHPRQWYGFNICGNPWVLWCHRLHMQAPVCTFSVTMHIAFMHGWICLYQNHSKQIWPLSGRGQWACLDCGPWDTFGNFCGGQAHPHHHGGLLHVPDKNIWDTVLVAVLPGKMLEEFSLKLVFILLVLSASLGKVLILQLSILVSHLQNLNNMSRPNVEIIWWVPPGNLFSQRKSAYFRTWS